MKKKIIRNLSFFICAAVASITLYHHFANRVNLRKFPYPFKAAVAICNDIDETTTVDEFLEIQKFLNTTRETSIGKGVGLEIGNSFWMYSADLKDNFTYFKGLTPGPSENASIIRDFIKSGYLDVIHTFGNFSRVGGFKREMAVKAFEELNKYGCKVKVWVNHGDRFNGQNIGAAPFYRGDNHDADEYHIDVTIRYGVEFLWTSDITNIIGQDANSSVFDVLKQERRPFEILKLFVGKDTLWTINKLLDIEVLDDATKIYRFKRYGFWEKPYAKDLADLISAETLKSLKSKNGYMIVYAHLGRNHDSKNFISVELQQALRYLTNELSSGEIYVTTTSKLLQYNLFHNKLDWTVRRKDGYFNIEINKILDEISGNRIPKLEDLQGITFYTPNAKKTQIFIGNQQISHMIVNPPDYTGKESVSIPLISLKFPEKYL